jgi:hypothetical protein
VARYNDRSGNGIGVDLNSNGRGDTVDLSTTDYTANGQRLFVTGAGAVVMRYPGSTADVTITAPANSLLPIAPGTIIRKTGTVATGLFSLPA